METFEKAWEVIYTELTSDDSGVRKEYMHLYGPKVEEFTDHMANCFLAWRRLDDLVKGDERRGYVAALGYTAITLHLVSLKLFLSGHMVAAGNLFRQVLESMALAMLSSGKDLDVLSRFIADRYSTNDAVRDVLRNAEALGLKRDALDVMKSSQEFYHSYSHVTRLTLANMISFSKEGEGTFVGASFDKGKADAYRKEVEGRLSLAKVFANFMDGVTANVMKWPEPPAPKK